MKSYDVNQTFIIEPQGEDAVIISACTAVYTNVLASCSGNTQIFMDEGVITFDGNLYTNDDLSASTINASTFLSGGTNLIDIFNISNISGGTFDAASGMLTLNRGVGNIIVTGFTDYYTTGTTIIGNTVYFNRNDALSAYTLDLSGFSGDTFVTGVTFNDNQLIIARNDGVNLNTYINTFTGLTINGLVSASTISAATISATTFYGDGSNLTGLVTQDTYVTGGTYNNSLGESVFTNNTGGTFSVTGFFTPSDDIYTTGVTFNNGNYDLSLTRNDGAILSANLAVLATDVNITGGTYDPNSGIAVFTNNTGGTFSVTGFLTGYTDTTVTAFTYNNTNSFTINTSNGQSFNALFDIVSGLTVNGSLSATTIYSGSTNLGDIFISNVLNTPTISGTNNNGVISNTLLRDFTSGIISGATLSINNDQTKFDISAGYGVIVDFWTTPGIQTMYDVIISASTTNSLTYLSSTTQTYITIDRNGNVKQYPSKPTFDVRRGEMILGQISHSNFTTIGAISSYQSVYDSSMETARDIISELKLINDGNIISANGPNLTINKSAGYLFGLGINDVNNHKNPNKIYLSGQTVASFKYRTQTGGTTSIVSLIDPTKYDLNGVITTIGGGSNSATNQRIYLFPNGALVIQYGQTVYSTLAGAITGVQNETFNTYSNLRENAILIGVLSLNKNATDLSNITQAKFSMASKFGEILGGTGGVSTTTLQQAYNNSTNPEILINSTLDGLSIQNGTGNPDVTTHLLEGQNTVGDVTSFITADGGFSGNTVSATTYYSGGTLLSTVIVNIINDNTVNPAGSKVYTWGNFF